MRLYEDCISVPAVLIPGPCDAHFGFVGFSHNEHDFLIPGACSSAPNPRELLTLVVFLFIAIGLSSVYLLNAIFLLKRVKRKASIILSIMSCIGFPLGTILGTISLLVLTRDEIKNEYS